MGSMSRPIWRPEFAPLMVRLPLGGYLLALGYMKFKDIVGFMENVKAVKVLPEQFAMPFGVLLPYVELAIGGFLIIGLWTTLSAVCAGVILLFYIYIFGVFLGGTWIPSREVILLICALSLLSSGSGAMSIDRFRQDG